MVLVHFAVQADFVSVLVVAAVVRLGPVLAVPGSASVLAVLERVQI